MTGSTFRADDYSGTGPENYERYFVPAIGGPVADDLLRTASLRRGERVLDVACGTGIVTRHAAEQVGDEGSVAGLDINPGMLAVARSVVPEGTDIAWHEASAEAMPLPDGSFDVVLCQMGLEFFPDRAQALREMRRVLRPGGRLVLNLPGPTPEPFAGFADALATHIDPKGAGFVTAVFSLHDPEEIRSLMTEAGFTHVTLEREPKTLRLPPPEDFMWQYIHSTPLAAVVAGSSEEQRRALTTDTVQRWQQSVRDGATVLEVQMTTVTAER